MGHRCPVCLKAYRDSEATTPMVCCDFFLQRWWASCVMESGMRHICSFQVDGYLQDKCSTCSGESYQVKDLEDAVYRG